MNLVDTLRWLVDIPSVTGSEARICDEVEARLLARLDRAEVLRVGDSLVAGRRTGRPLLLLVGHLDTVPSQGQGPAVVVDGRLHGLGAADMKGGLAVMLHLLEDPGVGSGPYDAVGVFYAGEEGPADANALEQVLAAVPWLTGAVFGVVLEPSDGEIQLGCNGVVNARVGFRGSSAHSARPWWGENAITKAGEWLAAMHRLEPVPYLIGGLEYREVFSVTTASGGIATNIIPPAFDLNLNYRFNPGRTVDEAVAELRAVCAAADVVEIVDAAPAGPVEADHPFLAALERVSGAVRAPKQGWTDVARLGARGVPAVNFGPGRAEQAHQVDEWVALDEVTAAYESLRSALSA